MDRELPEQDQIGDHEQCVADRFPQSKIFKIREGINLPVLQEQVQDADKNDTVIENFCNVVSDG